MIRSRLCTLAVILPTTLGLAAACSSSSGVSGPSPRPCDDYFDAIVGVACAATTPPADQVAHMRARFDALCQNLLALPGNGITSSSLEACAKALVASGCGNGSLGLGECIFQGSLGNGAPCNEPSQCQSGNCVYSLVLTDAGTTTPACGACVATLAVGAPCKSGQNCVPEAICARKGTGYACTTIAYGDVGSTCDAVAARCKTGLYCDSLTSQCSSPGAAGAPCTQLDSCTPPLECTGTGATTTCQEPSPAGVACQFSAECASGLGCSATHQCAPIHWASPGQPCKDLALCLDGNCPLTMGPNGPVTGGNCPAVIADGQPCKTADASQTCDTFSECVNGTCQQPDRVACR